MEGPILAKCENCLKELDESKLDIHFSYCSRNFKQCQKCGRKYDINYADDHDEEYHKTTKCEHCSQEFNAQDIKMHEEQCNAKVHMIECPYCNLKVPHTMYEKHDYMCKSRTVTCDLCNGQVPMDRLAQHETICMENLCKQTQTKPKKQLHSHQIENKTIGEFINGAKKSKGDNHDTEPKKKKSIATELFRRREEKKNIQKTVKKKEVISIEEDSNSNQNTSKKHDKPSQKTPHLREKTKKSSQNQAESKKNASIKDSKNQSPPNNK